MGAWRTRACVANLVVLAVVGIFSCFSVLNRQELAPGLVTTNPTTTEALEPSPKLRRTLAYCGKYGRFSNQVITLGRALWLAGRLNRQLVLPDLIADMTVAEILDVEYIRSFLQHAGGFLTFDDVGCVEMKSLWATPRGLTQQRDVRRDKPETLLGPPSCSTARHRKTGLRCSFGGAAEVRAFDSRQWNDTSSWAAIDQTLPPAMGMLAGMLYSLPVTFGKALPVIPFHPVVVEQARTVIDQLPAVVAADTNGAAARPVSMCAHVRRGDMASRQPPIAKVVQDILRFMASVEPPYRVGKLLLTHNANASEVEDLQKGLPPGIQISCDSEKWAMCSKSTLQIAVEQAACSMTDLFLGSRGSSFSDLIKEHRMVLHNKTRQSSDYTGMLDKQYKAEVSLEG